MLKETTLVLAVGMVGCGGSKGGDNSPVPVTKPEANVPHIEPYVSGLGSEPNLQESDLREAKVARCKDGEAFALEQCWQEVFWSEKGEVTFKSPNAQLQVINDQGVINPKVLALYEYSSTTRDGIEIMSNRLEQLHKFSHGHWTLPSTMETTNPKPGENKITGQMQSFHLTLDTYGPGGFFPFHGSATICGQTLALPLKQAAVEKACNVNIGSSIWSTHLSEVYSYKFFWLDVTGKPLSERIASYVTFTREPQPR